MAVRPAASPFFVPFPSQSVTLISSNTNTGKTTFVVNALKNRDVCFSVKVTRAVVVLCNPRVDPSVYTNLAVEDSFEVEVYYLDNFEPDQHLREDDVLIFEDVSELSELVLSSVNVTAHHLNLGALFVIVQSLFGTSNKNFRTLLTLVHKVVLFGNRGSVRLGRYLNQFFFSDPELKAFVEIVFRYAERNKDILLLDINETRKEDHSQFFALSGLQHFFSLQDQGVVVVFPQLFKVDRLGLNNFFIISDQ
jgi:hypothetical protein